MIDLNSQIPLPGGLLFNTTSRAAIRNPMLSVFGQAGYELPAGFEVQLGGRYSAVSTNNQNLLILQYGTPIPQNNQRPGVP